MKDTAFLKYTRQVCPSVFDFFLLLSSVYFHCFCTIFLQPFHYSTKSLVSLFSNYANREKSQFQEEMCSKYIITS